MAENLALLRLELHPLTRERTRVDDGNSGIDDGGALLRLVEMNDVTLGRILLHIFLDPELQRENANNHSRVHLSQIDDRG